MKALTIWQPWASLIIEGCKPYEFRRWAFPKSLEGQRIVIHAGIRPVRMREVNEILLSLEKHRGFGTGLILGPALDLLDKVSRNPTALMLGAGLGTAVLGVPQRAKYLFGQGDDDDIDPGMWAWPLSDIQPFDAPVPARGAQSFWDWKESA